MNKVMAQPNGPGPSMAEQSAFVNGHGTRLIGAPDSLRDKNMSFLAQIQRWDRNRAHIIRNNLAAVRLGKTVGTASR